MTRDVTILKSAAMVMAALFAIAGTLTLAFRHKDWGRNMGQATASWAVICALFLLAPFEGSAPFAAVMAAIAIMAVKEFYRMTGICRSLRLVVSAVFIVAMAAAVASGQVLLFHRFALLAVVVMFVVHAWRFSYEGIARTVALQVVGLIYWGWQLLHWLLLQRLNGGYGLILTLCAMIVVNDNGAFFFGKIFGRNSPKLAPRISPNKTWVGFGGGVLCSVLVAWGFGFALPHLSLAQRLVLGLVVGVAVPVGGLIESAFKRDAGVKDSGTLIPGHGGVMDRFDSWAFSAPITYFLMRAFACYPF